MGLLTSTSHGIGLREPCSTALPHRRIPVHADVAGASPGPLWCRCGRGKPSPSANVAHPGPSARGVEMQSGASLVPVQMQRLRHLSHALLHRRPEALSGL